MRTGDPEADEQVLQSLRLREPAAVEGLVERYGSALTRAAYLYLGDAHAAEEVFQEVCIAAWDAARRTHPATRLRPWLFGILFNRCRAFRRAWWRRIRREQAAGRQRPTRVEDQQDNHERLQRLRRALDRLDERLRAVVILRFERGLSVSETAEALELPEGTVKSRTHAAVRKLKAWMRDE